MLARTVYPSIAERARTVRARRRPGPPSADVTAGDRVASTDRRSRRDWGWPKAAMRVPQGPCCLCRRGEGSGPQRVVARPIEATDRATGRRAGSAARRWRRRGAEVEAAPAAGPGCRFRPAGSGQPVQASRLRRPPGSDCRFRPPGPPSPANAARRSGRYGLGEGDAPALGAGDPDGSGVAMGVGAGVGSGPSTGGKSTGIGSP